MDETNVRLKLVIESQIQRVVYGEADKIFIDFLFDLLSLPLGAVIRLLSKEAMVGCLGNLYHSIETFNSAYLHPNKAKATVLQPKLLFNSATSTKLLPYAETPSHTPSTDQTTAFTSSNEGRSESKPIPSFGSPFGSLPFGYAPNVLPQASVPCFGSPFGLFGSTVLPQASTPSVSRESSVWVKSESTAMFGEKVGFVKDLATYVVLDDLTVSPISDFSTVALLKKLDIKDMDSLEEKVVTLNVNEGVELLKASLESKTVLTDVFLRRRGTNYERRF